jgi:hypothetical protein
MTRTKQKQKTRQKPPKKPEPIPAAIRVQTIDIDLIKPYWRNPRLIDEAVPYVLQSIQRFGFQVPLLLDRDNVIIAGHTRYRAARQAGLAQLPCIVADLSEPKARELRIVDNKTSEKARWRDDLLTAELRALANVDEIADIFGGPEWDLLLGRTRNVGAKEGFGAIPENDVQGRAGSRTDVYEVTCPYCGKDCVYPIDDPSDSKDANAKAEPGLGEADTAAPGGQEPAEAKPA